MPACRACRHTTGQIVLDLGEQPACDYFPRRDDPGPDPVYPLQMWLCSRCGLAQLVADPTVPEEPRATEPAALAEQAADAVGRVAAAGLLPAGAKVAEYGSPHGGSWLPLLSDRLLVPVADGELADVVVDCFGLMHAADQREALTGRLARLDANGVLLVQYHSLATIVRCGQWNALRHGHYAYYSTKALVAMLTAQACSPFAAWRFDLYGGTVLLAAKRCAGTTGTTGITGASGTVDAAPARHDQGSAVASGIPAQHEHGAVADGPPAQHDHGAVADGPPAQHDHGAVADLLAEDAAVGVTDPGVLRGLEGSAQATATGLVDWLVAERAAGRQVLGYGAASRAVALLCRAGVDRSLLPAIADASPAKHGLRMPGTDIPVVSPAQLTASPPDCVLLFVSDLRAEVRAAFPEVEAAGGQWVDADSLARTPGSPVR